MNTFTDSELSKLKEKIKGGFPASTHILKRLITRLEKAEKVIENTWDGCEHDFICSCPISAIPKKEYKEWLRSKGE